MPVIGIQTTKDMLDVLFDAFDEDGSGEIGLAELQARLSHAELHCVCTALAPHAHCACIRVCRRRCASRA